jgi:hypothetical protein
MQVEIVVFWATALKVDPLKDVGIRVEKQSPRARDHSEASV